MTTAEFEFSTPHVERFRYDDCKDDPVDTEDNTYTQLVLDVPEAVRPYAPLTWEIDLPRVEWNLGWELTELFKNWAIAALDFPKTPKGNLRKADQEYLSCWLGRLHVTINADLCAWLESEPRYIELIRDRLNETIRDLVTRRAAKMTDAA